MTPPNHPLPETQWPTVGILPYGGATQGNPVQSNAEESPRDGAQPEGGRQSMKSMVMAFVAIAGIALCAAIVLNALPDSSAERYATNSVRL